MGLLKERLKEQYAPLAEQFVKAVEPYDLTGIPAPHIPIMGQDYESSMYRIAFIGMETYGWEDINKFIAYQKEHWHDVVCMNEHTINSLEYLKWPRNLTSTFWGFILKFLAKFYRVDLNALVSKEYPEILRSFIWGNTNSIERYGVTAEHQGASYEAWEIAKQASLCFDSINNLIRSVAPKLVFILYKNVDNSYITSDDLVRTYGIPVGRKKEVLSLDVNSEMKIRYNYIRKDDVHIITLPHPTWMGAYSGKSIDMYIDEILSLIKRFSIWPELPTKPEDWRGTTDTICKSSMEYKRKVIADLAKLLVNNNAVMSGKELQEFFKINQILTQSGYQYSDNGGRGIHRLITNVWNYYYTKKDFQTAYNISRAFVNQNGEYAWE